MTGSRSTPRKQVELVVQERDLTLLREAGTLKVFDREMAKAVAGFRSTTRANARLLHLTRAGLLRRFFIGTVAGGRKGVYALSRAGAATAGVAYPRWEPKQGEDLVADLVLAHQMELNRVSLAFRFKPLPAGVQCLRWRTFTQPLSAEIALIPDGYLELATPAGVKPFFVELDRGTEARRVWHKKASLYRDLAVSGEVKRLLGQSRFGVLVLAPSPRRLEGIRLTVATVTDKLFWLTTFSQFKSEQRWQPIWRRPTGDQLHSLL